MQNKCIGHNKIHEDFNWKFMDYTDGKTGNKRAGWFCRDFFKPTPVELVPQRIKDQRLQGAGGDLLQPFRQGEPSREFMNRWPQKAKKIFTPQQIKTAKNVWKGDVPGI